ncbi:MAG: beta-lactamase family protein [Planctomycetaceae bacterium]|nr:beta-lactamase family protein [Planctomycetaceae bacterium]
MRLLVSIAVFTCALHASRGVADEAKDVAGFVVSVGDKAVEDDKITGLSIGVAIGDEVLAAKGFGLANVELNVPVTADTVYRIGSITKQFTAAAILILVEDGKIDLDAPLTKYLPDYPSHGSAVTVKHLLQHTSGVADFTRLPEYRRDRPLDVSKDEVLDRFQNLPLKFPPGEKHRYCNSGYFLQGLIIEQASEKSFREFVESRLFEKLKMQHSYCDRSQTIIPHRAAGYTRWGGKLRNAPHISLGQTVGAGNISATMTDLIVWQRGLFADRLLRTETVRQMTTPGKLNDGKPFNYGFGVRVASLANHKVVRHGGGISGFRSDLAYYPDSRLTIVVLSNCEHANPKKISDRIARHMLNKTKRTNP